MCNPANPAMSLLTFIQGGVEITGDQAAEGAETLAEGVQGYAEQSILDVLIDSWYINVPLLILSVLAVYIFFERTMSINRALKEESNFMSKIKDYIFDEIEEPLTVTKRFNARVLWIAFRAAAVPNSLP